MLTLFSFIFIASLTFKLFYSFLFLITLLISPSILLIFFSLTLIHLLFSFFISPQFIISKLVFFSQPILQDPLQSLAQEDLKETVKNFFYYLTLFF
jgi:hypothetical protein